MRLVKVRRVWVWFVGMLLTVSYCGLYLQLSVSRLSDGQRLYSAEGVSLEQLANPDNSLGEETRKVSVVKRDLRQQDLPIQAVGAPGIKNTVTPGKEEGLGNGRDAVRIERKSPNVQEQDFKAGKEKVNKQSENQQEVNKLPPSRIPGGQPRQNPPHANKPPTVTGKPGAKTWNKTAQNKPWVKKQKVVNQTISKPHTNKVTTTRTPIRNQWDKLREEVHKQEVDIEDEKKRKQTDKVLPKELPECVIDWKCDAETNMSYSIDVSNTTFGTVYKENPDLLMGGTWKPPDCRPTWKLALIIPVRDREDHLRTFIRNMVPFLKKQKIQFSIFAVEHVGPEIFNKAQTMDAGFVESQKLGDYDCFIFHDVDMLPVNLCNIYRCEADGVRHLGISRDLENPHAEYWACIGGSSAFTKDQFHQINGFTTVMFGWGGEDDDGFFRIWAEDMELYRYEAVVGNYMSLPHERHNRKHFPKVFRGQETSTHWKYRKYDGLNSLNYKVVEISQNPVLTRIKIQIAGPRLTKELRPYLIYKQLMFREQLCKDNMCVPT